MSNHLQLTSIIQEKLKNGRVFIPSPLALNSNIEMDETYQRLLTLYYIKAGAKAVIPGAHTGEFALNDSALLEKWLKLIKEMTYSYGKDMLLFSAVGGADVLKQAEMAARYDYDVVMVAPTAFKGLEAYKVVQLFRDIASIIPTIAFELQKSIPGSYHYSQDVWKEIFKVSYGVKSAPFDTYRSLNMMEVVAQSPRHKELILLSGNDDRIVNDLLGKFGFGTNEKKVILQYDGGLLGHFATDTHAAVKWVNALMENRSSAAWTMDISVEELSSAVNRCNMALFDALNNFKNSVWGVKYRLKTLGLLPAVICKDEKGYPELARAIDKTYQEFPFLCDNAFLDENIDWLKREVGL
jgi:dihydrodipicolinate synthase/N-acetylneuraminate lyase